MKVVLAHAGGKIAGDAADEIGKNLELKLNDGLEMCRNTCAFTGR